MSLYASGIVRIISKDGVTTRPAGDGHVTSFYAGINEGKDKNNEYKKNAIDCEAWRKTGELIAQHFSFGDSFMAFGKIEQQSWTDKETGGNRSKSVFVIDRMEFLPRSSDEAAAPRAAASSPASAASGGFADDDEIPF
jgi:single-strand DNA-binding protein